MIMYGILVDDTLSYLISVLSQIVIDIIIVLILIRAGFNLPGHLFFQ